MPHVLRKQWMLLATAVLLVGCSSNLVDVPANADMSPDNDPDVRDASFSPDNKYASMTDAEWKQVLTPEQYYVTREHGTERKGSSKYVHWHKDGTFTCVCCGQSLFASGDKYESGSGWPSFTRPIDENNIGSRPDNTLFMRRTEVHCSRCGAHLGHVFGDGPQPTGLRYCMNGVAMGFDEAEEKEAEKKEAD